APGPDAGPFPPSPVTFHLPTTRLLNPLPQDRPEDNRAEIEERSRVIEDTLAEFGLNGAVTDVVCGPTITRYEVKPESGVKVDRIQGVHNNLQMNLRAKSLRIIAPIPGKDVVGLEVPNLHSRPVPLRGIAESPEWNAAVRKMALPMLLSRDIDGAPVIADLAKMPHMIVAGTTGSGKSVTLNAILAGWLLSRTPDQLRLVLVDPKRVEFTPYADIPHLVVPVITEAPKVAVCLQWAVKEMDRRLKLFQRVGVRNIAAFNTRAAAPRQTSLFGDADAQENAPDGAPATLPYMVIVIDEMSDLMMLAGADVEPRVVRLAQLARAVGIHLVIATQRPDVKVITGKIKANFPARIALKVASAIDSITILDQAGAQTLIGRGDMLFLNPTSTEGVTRSQSCWIDDGEIAALTKWYRDQGEPMYVPEIKDKLDRIRVKDSSGDTFKTFESEDSGGGAGDGGEDSAGGDGEKAFLQRCLDTLVSADRASTSMLQRKLRLGYNKAARVIDELEQLGCLGPANGSAPRDILRTTLPTGDEEGQGAADGADDADFGDDADE
ncbi:MAG: DNA translocase FtsK, partial [Kiritimatiellae bacterium]|nr:DNA translocase FtsK [Kiritimatiellia bacterium]